MPDIQRENVISDMMTLQTVGILVNIMYNIQITAVGISKY